MRTALAARWLLSIALLLSGAASAGDGDAAMERMFAACPGAARFMLEGHPDIASLEAARRSERATSAADAVPPTNPSLREALLEMSRVDQEARSGNLSDPAVAARFMAVDAANLPQLRAIVANGGFPTVQSVGHAGFNAAWLLVQHADRDPVFQQQMLELLLANEQIGGEQLAMLTDRVLRAQGKPQRYGSQFSDEGGTWMAQPIEAPLGELDARRASVGLMPMAAYTCFIRAMYETPAQRK